MEKDMWQKIKKYLISIFEEWNKSDLERYLSRAQDCYELERLEKEYFNKK